ncbi:hypothetical protein C8Q76DRAFT_38996 [Earliella scabrosa]|nr:hypothetical protein C8Q76DRAFT_38996 [Earliella scabrosa]
MQASGSTHTYAKRSAALEPPLIAGIVVVVVAFNLILAVSWCLLRDRKKIKKLRKRRISVPIDVEKYETSLAFAVTTGAVPNAAPVNGKKGVPVEHTGKSYYPIIRALQAQPTSKPSSSPNRLSRGSSHSSSSSSEERPGLKKFILRPQDMQEFNGAPLCPKTKCPGRRPGRQSTNFGIPARANLRRANSVAETASVYSSASAPIDYHEQLFRTQPFALDPTAPNSAPAWITQMPTPPSPAILSEASSINLDVPLRSPTASISEQSDASAIVPPRYAPPSPIADSPISVPVSSTASPLRARTYSNPSAPPQIRWLTKTDTPVRHKRPSSISSLSTIFSLREATGAPAVVVAPLNVRRRSNDSPWGSVDLTRSTPLSSVMAQPLAPPALAPPAVPGVPARSPRRPYPSVEHLPLTS